MNTATRWCAASAFAAVLLGAAGVAGPASACPAADVTPGGHAPPVPTVGGVQRLNVGATHSPALLRELSGPLSGTGPAATSALPRGVDVAAYQHSNGAAIKWTRVASAGYRFAFIKAAEGNYYVNPYYASDLARARAAGLYAVGYHFAVPTVSGGVNQADYAVSRASHAFNRRTLPIALDIEYDPYARRDHTNKCYGLSQAKMIAWIGAFDAEVRRLTGRRPIIYTTANWWNSCTGGSTAFAAARLWVASYGVSSPLLPRGWSNWTFWQYTAAASVPGIRGNTDGDHSNLPWRPWPLLAGDHGLRGQVCRRLAFRHHQRQQDRLSFLQRHGRAALGRDRKRAVAGLRQVPGRRLGGGKGTRIELCTCTSGANQRWTHLANGEHVLASNGQCHNDPG